MSEVFRGAAREWFSAELAAQTQDLEASWLRSALYRPATLPGLALSVLPADRSGAIWLRLQEVDRFDGAVCAAADVLPFADASFNLVLLQHAHEFCLDPASLIADCTRLLSPGGRLLISGFNPFAWSRWRRWRRGLAQRPALRAAGRLRRELQQLGLSCDTVRYLRWPDSALERHVPVRQMHAIYLLEASKRPPDILTLRRMALPAGALPG
jgi:SAM-dependent methyltransferase